MADAPSAKSSLLQLLRRFLASLSPEWVATVIHAVQTLRQATAGRHATGLYEILVYDAELELLDSHGKRAVFRKRQRVKFLQDHVITFQDYIWGEGRIFAGYRCKPGLVVDRYREGDRWNVVISLRATKQRGDVENFYIERKVENGFTRREEWRQVEIRHPTRKLTLAVRFPKGRHCRRAVIVRRSRNQTIPLGSDHFHELPDGRQLVRWEAQHIRPLEVYTLKWWW